MSTAPLPTRNLAVDLEQISETKSLSERMEEILSRATVASQQRDLARLRTESGELLCSLLQLCKECGWEPQDLIDQTLARVKSQEEVDRHSHDELPRVVSTSHRKLAIYAGTFDPPTRSDRRRVAQIRDAGFDEVIVCPVVSDASGLNRQHVALHHRAALVSLGFREMDRVSIDYDDLSHNRTSTLAERHAKYQQQGDVWHVFDDVCFRAPDDVAGLRSIRFQSDVAERVSHDNRVCLLRDVETYQPAGTVRRAVYECQSYDGMVDSLVKDYIERHRLFLPSIGNRYSSFVVGQPRLKIVLDERNPKSMEMAEKFRSYESDDPQLILVLGGDGTMLHAIREFWRMRLPFLGLNTGHLGFLMNERIADFIGTELMSYTLPMLRVDAVNPEGESCVGLAFSDVWAERAEGQAAWLQLDVDGETRLKKIVGDGMLISTAAGSSAYARAMGAVPVPLNSSTMTLVGSNVFEPRFWRPMTLPDDSVITFTSLDRSGKRKIRSFVDGMSIGLVQKLSIRKSLTASVELAFTREFDPSARLLRSLFPPGAD